MLSARRQSLDAILRKCYNYARIRTYCLRRAFARIFYRNGINNGMLLIETDDLYDRCEEGDLLTVEVNRCLKVNGQVIPIRQIPDNLFEIIKAGGLVPRYRALNEAAEAAESVQKEVH